MNKKAQDSGPLATIILLMVFVILWFLFLANFTNEMADTAVTGQGLTGAEAFFFSNLNLIIFIGLTLGTMLLVKFGFPSG